jgi:hypothetical protein
MQNNRKKYSVAQHTSLISQVERVCPLCSKSLFYKKKSKTYNHYELAHIYPLNPTEEELDLLKMEQRLSDDVNHEDNLIPLCTPCHDIFDTPRTVEEYRKLFEIKSALIKRSQQEEIWSTYKIEQELELVIEALYDETSINGSVSINFDAKEIDEKLNSTIASITKRKVKNHVRDYYQFIKERFSILDQSRESLSQVISLQIKAYYLIQKDLGISQQEIYQNIVNWINAKTKPKTSEASEIITAFFIQNCEVF